MRRGVTQIDDSLKIEELLSQVEDFRKSILEWYEFNWRHWIPWKLNFHGSIPDSREILPVYRIWIAEVML